MPQLALGTVQFGLPYGVTNTQGQVSEEDGRAVLHRASQYGISMLDTAAAYGQSEEVLSKLKAEHDFQIVSKTLPLLGKTNTLTEMMGAIERSLQLLSVKRALYGMLIHHPDDLLGPTGKVAYAALQKMQDAGRIQKIGVSIYTGEEIEASIQQYRIDIIQLPHNVLDQRLRKSGHLNKLRDSGVEICVRSAFLQGLLLQNMEQLPSYLHQLTSPLTAFFNRARELECSPLTLALGYLRQQETIDHILVGVLNVKQLDEIWQAWRCAANLPDGCANDLGIDDDLLLNPARWAQLEAGT
ncbi:aldo/keto reductase [Chromobacterium piscinae]|uniref:aldo/keto reductase n=1 Tax=Chromobacterium piscinae TaxID=686831 RepID=UPI00140BCEC8|nr:aldo/keto reductase [Chromobacterium piscinae]MBX9295078.1 aldo/keto reductase [Chromobacterium vaccinii]MBX9358844.1 aldo/keto reductase [Chromobacterium vaccinii]MCD4506174.1 aldo/keto reductase [Chromobacterium piscinae]MCD5326848.1 aldo/keto reductase [Chromobacterium piscinae]NHQ82512.1 aldo/keto reductase [Chromobacterium vaccinii]